ncbi:non-hydrolyzing UDP-N-acetylglucosamine 2-epimerase [Chloroflexota bacterium]
MKVMTILGTRPEIIRLSRIIKKLDALCNQVLVHTGQNYDLALDKIFFKQLGVREPEHYLGARGSFGEQIGTILAQSERIMLEEKPDRFLVLGDTNSSLAAIMAKRQGIPVYHMEAGNRCYDDRVPEEVNRRIIDHSSDVLLPYTERSRANLLREGIPSERIYVTGNPIYEVIQHYDQRIRQSTILTDLGLATSQYFLVTMHRAENVDHEDRLKNLLVSLDEINKKYALPVVCSLHPRTKSKIQQFGLKVSNVNIRLLEPFGYFDFVSLERNALCVITDSGTVQEECCIFKVPNITIRDVTERPETIESGSNILTSVSPHLILKSLEIVLNEKCEWDAPVEYLTQNVSSKVVKILLGHIN